MRRVDLISIPVEPGLGQTNAAMATSPEARIKKPIRGIPVLMAISSFCLFANKVRSRQFPVVAGMMLKYEHHHVLPPGVRLSALRCQALRLEPPHTIEQAAPAAQICRRAILHNAPLIQNDHSVEGR